MSIFSGFFSLFSNGSTEKTSFGTEINPANGLPMTDGIGSVDVAGNPYGTDLSSINSGFDNSFFTSHDTSGGCGFSPGGSGFGGFGGGNDW